MKYYSDVTKKLYDDEKSLVLAETEIQKAQDEKLRKAEEKKSDAKVVEEAYKNTIQVRKECSQMIDEADRKYRQALKEFQAKYPEGYHMTFKDEDGNAITDISYGKMNGSLFDLFEDFFNLF